MDLVTPVVFGSRSELLLGSLAGMCIGQVNLIAAWAALARGNVMFRLPWSMLLGVLMWYGLVLGYRLQELLDSLDVISSHSHLDMGETVVLGIVLVVGIVVAQIPLWIAGQIFRWKLVCGEMSNGVDRHQFNLRHLLLGMFLLSLVLGAARVILPTEEHWSQYRADLRRIGCLGLVELIQSPSYNKWRPTAVPPKDRPVN